MDFFQEWLGDLGIDSEVTAMDSSTLTDVILDGNFDIFQWGWYVEPDPDSMLSYFTCDQRGGLVGLVVLQRGVRRAVRRSSTARSTRPSAAEIVKQMQEILYQDAPYLVTAYTPIGEAVRSDRFACFQPQPDPGGVWLFQYGVHNYTHAPAGRRGRRLRRRHHAPSARPQAVGARAAPTAAAAPTLIDRRRACWPSLVVGGGIVLLRRRVDGGRPRVTALASQRDRRPTPARRASRRRAAQLRPLRRSARCSARSAACCSCWS